MADVAQTIAGIDALIAALDDATRQITADAAHIIQAKSMKEAPVGVAGNSTNMPGDLRRSIMVTGPHGGDGVYEALVGPTVVYGRQRELGGAIYPVVARFLRFTKFGHVYYRRRVYQEPNPYMLRGEMGSLAAIEAMARARVAEVVVTF